MSHILIDNYTNNETVFHSFVLIKGRVTNPVHSHSEISVFFPGNQQQAFTLSKKGQFKVLLELKFGDNEINLCYNDTHHHQLNLNYVKSNQNVRKVQPVYLLCSDTRILQDQITINCSKLLLGCKLAQCFYSEKLFEATESRKTFQLAEECNQFCLNISETEAYRLSDQELWELVGRQLIESSIWDITVTKFIAFTSFTKYLGITETDTLEYSYAQIKARTLSNPALSSGGLALLGTGCLYTWPSDISHVIRHFLDKTRVDITKQLDDSNYRCTYGGCFSTTLGGVCHELGHIFDLGHTCDGIMGKDIDYVGRVFVTELHTENLPDRIVGAAIKRSEKAQRQRFTKINREPGQYLIKYHEQKDEDLSFFAQNNLIALAFHKWFSVSDNIDENHTKNYNKIKFERNTVYGDVQLVLIEIRKCVDEMLVQFWQFTEEDVYEFKLPDNCETLDTVLFVMDIEGNILKEKF